MLTVNHGVKIFVRKLGKNNIYVHRCHSIPFLGSRVPNKIHMT